MLRRLQSLVGAALVLVGGLAAVVLVAVDRWRARRAEQAERQQAAQLELELARQRAEHNARAERLRARVRQLRQLADTQARAVADGKVRQLDAELERDRQRDPVDVANELVRERGGKP